MKLDGWHGGNTPFCHKQVDSISDTCSIRQLKMGHCNPINWVVETDITGLIHWSKHIEQHRTEVYYKPFGVLGTI